MSNNYTSLNSVTDGEAGKPESSEDIAPNPIPQSSNNEVANQKSTQNFLLLQEYRKRNNKNISKYLPSEKPNPKRLLKAKIYSFILLGVLISDLLIHFIAQTKSIFGVLGDVFCIIYLIILLFILFSSKIDYRKDWPKHFVISMSSFGIFIQVLGLGLSLLNFFTNPNFKVEIKSMLLWLLFFISILIIKAAILFRIIILVVSFEYNF